MVSGCFVTYSSSVDQDSHFQQNKHNLSYEILNYSTDSQSEKEISHNISVCQLDILVVKEW